LGGQETDPPFLIPKKMTIYNDTSLPHIIDPEGRFGEIIIPVIRDMGFRLVRVAFNGSDPKRGAILQILIEPLDGSKLKIESCKEVSHTLSAVLDVADPISDHYVLEVGSAGLDRPLSDKGDFKRFVGFEGKFECKTPDDNGQRRYRGFIESVDDAGFTVKTQERGSVHLAWHNLSVARLVACDELLKALQNGSV
jgi:ribosome maturation factor RimP